MSEAPPLSPRVATPTICVSHQILDSIFQTDSKQNHRQFDKKAIPEKHRLVDYLWGSSNQKYTHNIESCFSARLQCIACQSFFSQTDRTEGVVVSVFFVKCISSSMYLFVIIKSKCFQIILFRLEFWIASGPSGSRVNTAMYQKISW